MTYIVDDIGTVVEAMRPLDVSYGQDLLDYMAAKQANTGLTDAPFYMYGHRLEIANRLLEKDADKTNKFKKYPLIALRMDIAETVRGNVVDYNLNIAILSYTDSNYNAEERYTNIFRPVLYPLYERFFEELKASGLFMWTGNQAKPLHTKFDRPFWGTPSAEANQKQIFNDPLDAIEIIDLKISSRQNRC